MRTLTFILALLVGASSFAQAAQGGGGQGSGNVKRGHFLKPEQYATQATVALFVDGASGNDSNACTASGASACLTIQGALNKVPQVVQNPVTIDITAGNYAGFRIYNKVFAASNTTTGSYINIRGAAQANVTPATGTATGTATSVSTDSVGFHTVTDSGQTWTSDDFTGRFLALTGGTGSGQVCPIISNTATAVKVSCTFSPAPVAGTTYAITSPSVFITSAASNQATTAAAAGSTAAILVNSIIAPRRLPDLIQIQDIDTSGAYPGSRTENGLVRFLRMRMAQTNQPGVLGSLVNFVQFDTSVCSSGTATCVTLGGSAATANGGLASRLEVTNAFLTSNGSGVGTIGSSVNYATITTSELTTTHASGYVFYSAGFGGVLRITNSRLRCSAASSNVAAYLDNASTTGVNGGTQFVSLVATSTSEVEFETCGTGLLVAGAGAKASLASGSGITFLSNTLAVNATGGGKVAFVTAVPTFTSNTTDISVDGATSTRAAFVALTPNSIVDLSYLSAVYLQP